MQSSHYCTSLAYSCIEFFVLPSVTRKCNKQKVFSSFFWIFVKPMKRYEQYYTCLNEVLLLKLLQIIATCRYTIAWINFFMKTNFIITQNSFFKSKPKNAGLGMNKITKNNKFPNSKIKKSIFIIQHHISLRINQIFEMFRLYCFAFSPFLHNATFYRARLKLCHYIFQ